jgi:hypothetical protein
MAEGHGVGDAMGVPFMNQMAPAAQGPAALGTLALQQVTFARFRTQNFARGGNLEPLGDGLLGLNAFWTTHKSFRFPSKERAL